MRRRAELVEAADSALMLMTRELRAALPNSVRVRSDGGRTALEFIPTLTGGRYRAALAGDGSGDVLDFATTDTGFDVMGELELSSAAGLSVVVYNLTATGAAGNAYLGDNRTALDAGASSAGFIGLNPGHQFPFASPQRRFQVVSGPVSYVCDPTAGELRRVEGYGFAGNPFAASGALVAGYASGCQFGYDAGAGTRNGLVSIRLTLSDAGETISLLQQVHVLNTP
jgi:MSHA biogenesis protein MshO